LERRRSLISTLFFIIIMFLTLATSLELPPIIAFGGLIIVSAVVILLYKRQRGIPVPSDEYGRPPPIRPPTRQEEGFKLPQIPQIGRWIIIPIALIGVVGFIVFENWWLNVTIRTALYLNKAATDWWGISFLKNTYFYAILAIGLLVVLSDPRVRIERTPEGRRHFYLHSKVLGLVNMIRGEIYEFRSFSPFPSPATLGASFDQVPLRTGIVWKLAEFAGGCLLIAPSFAKDWAFRYLIVSNWTESQGIGPIGLLQRAMAVLYGRLITAEVPTGSWLIDNSPIFEFLVWLRIPIMVVGAIWAIRLFISFILEFRAGRIIKAFRNIIVIGVIILSSILVTTPTQAFDVTTPYYLRSMVLGWITLTALAIFLSLRESLTQSVVGTIFRRRIILTGLVVLVALSLLYGPVVVAVQINPAIQGKFVDYLWVPKYLPNVDYTRWATGIDNVTESQIQTAVNTGQDIKILSNVRLFSREAAKSRLIPSIGVNWMDFPSLAPDVINVNGTEYWITGLTIVQPPTGGEADTWRSQRLLYTHSERVLGLNAHDGQVLPNAAQTIFGVQNTPAIYYGEGGLFDRSPMVYIGIPTFAETHISNYTGPAVYSGDPDYVLDGFERFWFFSGLFGQEQLRWDFGRGDYGTVKMLYLRDIADRMSQILLPGMTLDNDPYLVSDGTNLYYSFYVYIARDMPTEYLDYAKLIPGSSNSFTPAKFLRLFANVLINAYDGSMNGFLLGTGEDNYLLDFYGSMYPQWNMPVPAWLIPQLRYPEFLLNKQIDSYNYYHVSDVDKWQKSSDFFALTTNAAGAAIEEVRYVTFPLNGVNLWTGVRLVESRGAAGKNLAGIYVALNGENLGNVTFFRSSATAIIGPQTALDSVNNFAPTREQLTLHNQWTAGNTLMYVISGNVYYFIPYYAPSATTTNVAMMTVVDATSQKVGYYIINNPQNPVEVASATGNAYSNLIGTVVTESAETRRQNTFKEFTALNYTLKTPQILNPPVAYQVGKADYLTDQDLPGVTALIQSFVTQYAIPTGATTIIEWETTDNNRSNLNFGVFSSPVELDYVTVTYASG